MKIPDYTPKFKKLNGRFPLTRFAQFLTSRGYAANTVQFYVSSIRRMLFHLREGEVENGETRHGEWRDDAAVSQYFATLNRGQHAVARSALTLWLAFNEDVITHDVATRAARSSIAAALRILLAEQGQGRGVPAFTLNDVPLFVWAKIDDAWAIRHADVHRFDVAFLIPIQLQPLMDMLRAWGRGDVGSPLIPEEPGSIAPMSYKQLLKLIDNKVPSAVSGPIERALEAAQETARARLPKPKPQKVIDVEAFIPGESRVKIVDGELITDRSGDDAKAFDNFELPDDA